MGEYRNVYSNSCKSVIISKFTLPIKERGRFHQALFFCLKIDIIGVTFSLIKSKTELVMVSPKCLTLDILWRGDNGANNDFSLNIVLIFLGGPFQVGCMGLHDF